MYVRKYRDSLSQHVHIISAQDVLERAQSNLAAGRVEEAIRHYHLGEEVIRDALALDVPSSGLGPAFSNTASWQADLAAWLPHIHNRSISSLQLNSV